MDKCFVIQPFDKGKFDKRFNDIFKPAIEGADLEVYRVDQDLSVTVPIEEIEKNIKESQICFAEITSDNPNVWYELGFAFACDKDVVMVCSEERTGKFPFDIQHRHIITYKTGSISDFENLGRTITDKIKALRSKRKTTKSISSTPIADRKGLKSHEIAILAFIMGGQLTSEGSIGVWGLKNDMEKSGYTSIATSVGIRSLVQSGLIRTFEDVNPNNMSMETFLACQMTELGEKWMLDNQDQLEFRIKFNDSAADDLPF